MAKQRGGWIDFNAPVVLGMALLALVVVVGNHLTGGMVNYVFASYHTAWTDPMQYVRLFTHVICHADFAHYSGNFLLILAVGPMVEEKYGSGRLGIMVLVTALITGLINVLFSRDVMLLGASGIVFMLVLLASFTNIRQGRIPLTVLLVGVLYIGNEFLTNLTVQDNVSRVSHIAGGICGAAFGSIYHGRRIWGGK